MRIEDSIAARTLTLVLAGGEGLRLSPLTRHRPKPAVSFGGMFRIIDFTLSNCFSSGLGRVSLVTQYRHEELHRYVREGWVEHWVSAGPQDRLPLVFLPPASGKRYRGTADAVLQNAELLQADPADYVLLLSGDHVYHMDYRGLLEQHARTGADLTIATVEQPLATSSNFGVIETNPSLQIIAFEEKPVHPRPLAPRASMALVSMGVYVFKKQALLDSLAQRADTDRGHDFGYDIVPAVVDSGRAYAYDFRDPGTGSPCYWRDIGTLDAYFEANMDLVQAGKSFDPYAKTAWPLPGRYPSFAERIEAKRLSTLSSRRAVTRSILSRGVFVEEGAVVADSILMPEVRVGRGAQLRRAIVEEGVSIPPGFMAGFDLEHDRRNHKVTESGVVVVSHIPETTSSTVLSFTSRASWAGATSLRRPEVGSTLPQAMVLFVDGNEEIREMMRTYLEVQQFGVITASNGLEGLIAFQNNEGIRVVVTDLDMPLMSGGEMIQQILKLNPTVRVIVASSDIESDDKGLQARVAVSLPKPYAPHDLAIAVRAAL